MNWSKTMDSTYIFRIKLFPVKLLIIKHKRLLILNAVPISLWPMLGKEKGIFRLGTLTIMIIVNYPLFLPSEQGILHA